MPKLVHLVYQQCPEALTEALRSLAGIDAHNLISYLLSLYEDFTKVTPVLDKTLERIKTVGCHPPWRHMDTLKLLVMRLPPLRAGVLCGVIRNAAPVEVLMTLMDNASQVDQRPALIAAAEVGDASLVAAVLTGWPLPVRNMGAHVRDALEVATLHHAPDAEVVQLLQDAATSLTASADII
jgi:hypothetical protein